MEGKGCSQKRSWRWSRPGGYCSKSRWHGPAGAFSNEAPESCRAAQEHSPPQIAGHRLGPYTQQRMRAPRGGQAATRGAGSRVWEARASGGCELGGSGAGAAGRRGGERRRSRLLSATGGQPQPKNPRAARGRTRSRGWRGQAAGRSGAERGGEERSGAGFPVEPRRLSPGKRAGKAPGTAKWGAGPGVGAAAGCGCEGRCGAGGAAAALRAPHPAPGRRRSPGSPRGWGRTAGPGRVLTGPGPAPAPSRDPGRLGRARHGSGGRGREAGGGGQGRSEAGRRRLP